MDSLTQRILTTKTAGCSKLARWLRDAPAKKTLRKNKSNVMEVLNTLSPVKHSLGCTMLLAFLCEEKACDTPDFVEKASAVLSTADPRQVLTCQREFSTVARRFGDFMLTQKASHQALEPLRSAITILQDSSLRSSEHCRNRLTAVHPTFVRLALKAGDIAAAAPIVKHDICDLLTDEDGNTFCSARDNLEYHYYAALVHCAEHRFERALEALCNVLTAPSEQLSVIQIEAFKKYILVSLIVSGTLAELPRFAPNIVRQRCPQFCVSYNEIVSAYPKGPAAVKRLVDTNHHFITNDKNAGLVRVMFDNLVRRTVLKLTSTYLTLSLNDIAHMADLHSANEARSIVQSMIDTKEINAAIDGNMVSFLEEESDTAAFQSQASLKTLEARIQEAMVMVRAVEEEHKSLQLHPDYIKAKLKRSDSAEAGDVPELRDDMDDEQLARSLQEEELRSSQASWH